MALVEFVPENQIACVGCGKRIPVGTVAYRDDEMEGSFWCKRCYDETVAEIMAEGEGDFLFDEDYGEVADISDNAFPESALSSYSAADSDSAPVVSLRSAAAPASAMPPQPVAAPASAMPPQPVAAPASAMPPQPVAAPAPAMPPRPAAAPAIPPQPASAPAPAMPPRPASAPAPAMPPRPASAPA
ncbi:MAG: hypothetical protein ACI376_00080, partial [Candidatus Bruticola sp.]